jgi:hypothetical protein
MRRSHHNERRTARVFIITQKVHWRAVPHLHHSPNNINVNIASLRTCSFFSSPDFGKFFPGHLQSKERRQPTLCRLLTLFTSQSAPWPNPMAFPRRLNQPFLSCDVSSESLDGTIFPGRLKTSRLRPVAF